MTSKNLDNAVERVLQNKGTPEDLVLIEAWIEPILEKAFDSILRNVRAMQSHIQGMQGTLASAEELRRAATRMAHNLNHDAVHMGIERPATTLSHDINDRFHSVTGGKHKTI